MSTGKLGAIAVGCVGIILVSTSGIGLAAASDGHCGYKTVTNNTEVRNKTSATSQEWVCIKFTAGQLAGSLLALIGGSLMWSISSSMFNATSCSIFSVLSVYFSLPHGDKNFIFECC